MNSSQKFAILMVVTGQLAGPVWAQNFDGYYRPWSAAGDEWSCKVDDLGMDGGTLGIINGYLEGVENRCQLSNPQAVADTGAVFYTATCSGEGDYYTENVLISKADDGIAISRGGHTIIWRSCSAPKIAATGSLTEPTNRPWASSFAMGVLEIGTRDVAGNSIMFSCEGSQNGRLYVAFSGAPALTGNVEFDVDGYKYNLWFKGDGYELQTDCNACASNYVALWEAAAAGNRLTMTAGGRSVSFNLKGSRKVLGTEACVPVGYSY